MKRNSGDTKNSSRQVKNEKKKKFSESDYILLRAYEPVAEGLAAFIGKNCEVVINCLEDTSRSVMKIVNSHITGRTVGSPLTDLGLEALKRQQDGDRDIIGPYFSRMDDGRVFKSITISIRNAEKDVIGLLCLNIDLSFPLQDVIQEYSSAFQEGAHEQEFYPHSVEELVHKSFNDEFAKFSGMKGISSVERNMLIVQELYKKGLFDVKGVVENISKEMGVTKYTIYNYLREIKGETKNDA